MRIVIDLLGADLGAEEIVNGVVDSLDFSKSNFTLVGPKAVAEKVIEERKAPMDRFEFIDTEEFVRNEEDPVRALRRKKDASIVLGLNRLNEDGYDGIITCGSTGAFIAGGIFITKRTGTVERATLATVIPTLKGKSILVDSGAVVDAKPEMLEQFAVMGSIYSQKFLNIENPKVALLNVGVEEGKGDIRTKEAYDLLKKNTKINFAGNLEARDFLEGNVDVVVTDGFAGNVLLKSTEGTAKVLLTEIKNGIMSKLITKIGALLLKPVFGSIKKKFDYKEVGVAVLLGIRKPLFKAHGSSDRKAIMNGIKNAETFINNNINKYIEEEFNG